MRYALGLVLLVLLAAAAWWIFRPAPSAVVSADVTTYLTGDPDEGFARVTEPRPLVFPADEGAHPAYQTEWWYYTGNLAASEAAGRDAGRRFGYQLTFFRSSLEPEPDPRDSAWGTGQVYLAHFTVSDVAAGAFHSAERFARGGAGLAGAEIVTALAAPRVWLETWSAAPTGDPSQDGETAQESAPATGSLAGDGATLPFDPVLVELDLEPGGTGFADPTQRVDPDAAATTRLTRPSLRLRAADGPVAIDLSVRPAKPAALHGREGYSVKGDAPGNASFYYSWSRLEATGTFTTADGVFPVEGYSWMDHEWSTSALAEGQTGWDWFSLQLDDDTELMAFQIREADGGIAPQSSGSLIDPDGAVTPFGAEELAIEVLDTWTSPRTGGEYPNGWRLRLPEREVDLTVTPLLDDQELAVSFRYWEGAVRVEGTVEGRTVSGYGYVEMTGYAPTADGSAGPGL
jgi:predicted secreted hydrolase